MPEVRRQAPALGEGRADRHLHAAACGCDPADQVLALAEARARPGAVPWRAGRRPTPDAAAAGDAGPGSHELAATALPRHGPLAGDLPRRAGWPGWRCPDRATAGSTARAIPVGGPAQRPRGERWTVDSAAAWRVPVCSPRCCDRGDRRCDDDGGDNACGVPRGAGGVEGDRGWEARGLGGGRGPNGVARWGPR